MANLHVGSTDYYDNVCYMGSGFLVPGDDGCCDILLASTSSFNSNSCFPSKFPLAVASQACLRPSWYLFWQPTWFVLFTCSGPLMLALSWQHLESASGLALWWYFLPTLCTVTCPGLHSPAFSRTSAGKVGSFELSGCGGLSPVVRYLVAVPPPHGRLHEGFN